MFVVFAATCPATGLEAFEWCCGVERTCLCFVCNLFEAVITASLVFAGAALVRLFHTPVAVF